MQMSRIAKQLHSLTLTIQNGTEDDVRNTWDDWHLVPTSRPVLKPPEVKTYEQDIPGADGKIDLTDVLTGYPAYKNRTGSIEFMVMHDGVSTSLGDSYGYNNDNNVGWAGTKALITNWLHGKKVRVESADVTDWYYLGRMTVDEWKSDEVYSLITLNYDLEPFRYSITDSGNQWKWDPFSFVDGVIRTYGSITIGSSTTVTGTAVPVVPTIFVTSDCTLTTPKGTFQLKAGSNKNPLILIYPGNQTWSFSGGSGSAAIYFRERSF